MHLPAPPEGHHRAARRLAEAIREGARARLALDDDALSDDALEAVAGGALEEVYRASAGFLSDWRRDELPLV